MSVTGDLTSVTLTQVTVHSAETTLLEHSVTFVLQDTLGIQRMVNLVLLASARAIRRTLLRHATRTQAETLFVNVEMDTQEPDVKDVLMVFLVTPVRMKENVFHVTVTSTGVTVTSVTLPADSAIAWQV